MKQTLHDLLGIGDGEGNTSLMRVIVLLVVLAVLVPKVYCGIKTGTPITFTTTDFEVLGGALGAKLFQNSQESKPQSPKA